MSFGVGPYGFGAIGAETETSEEAPRKTLVSARKIDPQTMRYVQNDHGGFEAMSSTAQRALLLVTFEVEESPIIDARYAAIMEARIRKALEPLTRGPEPAIQLVSVSVTDDARHGAKKVIVFKDLKNQTTQTVEAT
jgi:hypothetical protein